VTRYRIDAWLPAILLLLKGLVTCDASDMSDLSLLTSKDSGSDPVKQLFNKIRCIIAEAKEHQLLTYRNVDPQTGSIVVDWLVEDGVVECKRPR